MNCCKQTGLSMNCCKQTKAPHNLICRGTGHEGTGTGAVRGGFHAYFCSYYYAGTVCRLIKQSRAGAGCEQGKEVYGQEGASRRRTVIMSPAGTPYTQEKARAFSGLSHLILICGHYEGMDARIYSHADEQVSIGDYILTGGEPAARVVIDSIARLLPGSLRDASTREESFENGLLEYPQYTQPAVYEGEAVPEVLRSGNHEKICRWRLQQSLLLTRKMRPDLFAAHVLTAEEEELLAEADREPDNTVSVE